MKKVSPLISIPLIFITIIFVIYVLYIGASIFIPFVLALFFSFIVLSITGFYRNKWLPKYVSLFAAFLTISVAFFIIQKITQANVDDIVQQAPYYQEKLNRALQNISTTYNLDQKIIGDQIIGKLNIATIISTTASIITSVVTNIGIIVLFMIFILLESNAFRKKMVMITGSPNSQFFRIMDQIKQDMKLYFQVKTYTSLMIAGISAIIMYFFWLDFFLFWSFLIFLLNYIPNIWSIIAVFFPVVFSLIQFESVPYTLWLAILLTVAQFIVWNIVEPRLMGNKLNLSPLVILISLIFWWAIWWPVGMLLSVPITVMLNIVLAHIPATRNIAILLSEDGNIEFPEEQDVKKKLSIKKMKKLLKKQW